MASELFIAMLSHELRTPLNAILGWAQIVRSRANEETIVQRGLDVIERNARLQLQLIDDLLDAERLVAGKMQVRAEPVDLRQVVLAAVDSVRPLLDRKPRALGLSIAEDFGMAVGDAGRLQQVVGNLLSNAIKFTPDGGRVDLTATHEGLDARIIVRDNGRGISPEALPHIFEPYWQAASASDVPEGLGLGLAVARYLVEAHGGTIAAESDGEGRGATVIVTLPLTAEQAPGAGPAGARRAAPPDTSTPR